MGIRMQMASFVAGEITAKETQTTQKGKTEVTRNAAPLFLKWSA